MKPDFITKRPHKKSRAGCQTCKTRKIKCDEVHPKCSFCDFRGLDCVYAPRPSKPASISSNDESQVIVKRSRSTSSSSDDNIENIRSLMPVAQSSAGNLTTFDLQVMHHYCLFTWNSLSVEDNPETNGVLRVRIPQLAFENEFLMNAILGTASLHMQTLVPDASKIRLQTDIYRDKAFRGFREILNHITPENYEAALIMSLMLVILVSKDYNTPDDDLLKGISGITGSSIGPVFRRSITELSATPMVPQLLLQMLASIDPLDPEYMYLEAYCMTLDSLGMLFASLQSDGLGPALTIRVITWPSYLREAFIAATKEMWPRALVITAWYLSFLKLVSEVWWVESVPERDLRVILKILPAKWLSLVRLPAHALRSDDRVEIAKMMLSC
ncbi:hypothetical protein BP6252_00089 [Coleophoma cylindrospora]|uniref:Zn(2)-C6 fungal-type domain-containing protein n=1 Tax=Coleophoma cylindrospora TaxID=1849047 RepID=A0A3D8SP30_9HELO|nr:hypothetical protein BP6252_00089 [Coleophoma cylindrospora]